jgi:hypothetical protein
MRDSSLEAVLTSGSSRVFNCAAAFDRLPEGIGALFRTRLLNASVLIKDTPPPEVELRAIPGDRRRRRIATKLYLPYDTRDIYRGGVTVYYGTKEFETALTDMLDLKTPATREAFTLDCYVLDMIDTVPSVSPFLLRDKFRMKRILINQAYYDVPAEEWVAIDGFVRSQLMRMVRSLYPGEGDKSDQFTKLLDLLWHLEDCDELRALGRVFRIPENEVLDTFFAWKGVIFYSYEHARRKEAIHNLLRWLEDTKKLLDPKQKRDEAIKALILHLLGALSTVVVDVEAKLNLYQNAFNQLFLTQADYAPFLKFLEGAQSYFQSIGIGLARLDHLTEIWERGGADRRRLALPDRADLLRILVDHGPSADAMDE